MLTRSFGATVWSLLMRSLLVLRGCRSRPDFVRRCRIETAQALVACFQVLNGAAWILRGGARRRDEPLQALRGEGGLPLVEPVGDDVAIQLLIRRLREGGEPRAAAGAGQVQPRAKLRPAAGS